MEKLCAIKGCHRRVQGRGWCGTHYYHWRIHGDPEHQPYGVPSERFWSKVDMAGSCWLWTAGKDRDGYGVFSVQGRYVRANRFCYELVAGEKIPDGMVVMHTCDNPSCVNPDHLRLGTNADNCADAARKGRRLPGSQNHQAKLTEEQVDKMRKRYALGGVTRQQLANTYGVSLSLVGHILARRAWKHI